MQENPKSTPSWSAHRAQQEGADEWLLAEVVKEVITTLLSRGITRQHALLEGYKVAVDLVRLSPLYIDCSSTTHVMIALRVFCIAQPPLSLQTGTDKKRSPSEIREEPQPNQDLAPYEQKQPEQLPKYRGRRRQQKRLAQVERKSSPLYDEPTHPD